VQPRPLVPPRLASDRCVLRPLRAEDAGAFAGATRDPDVVRFSGLRRRHSAASARELIASVPGWARSGKALELAVADPASDAFWGSIGLWKITWEDERAELGFWIVPGARRRGAAGSAVRLLARWAFDELGLARLEALSDHDNPAAHGALSAAGFRPEGRMRSYVLRDDGRADVLVFGLLPEDLLVT
jgi:[ribosomal protein S5]-alanine N-acetyltransferase